jgi:hypothetical protein
MMLSFLYLLACRLMALLTWRSRSDACGARKYDSDGTCVFP